MTPALRDILEESSTSGFSPSSIAGLVLWLDVSDASTVTIDGSNNYSQIRDKSGNAFHANQVAALRNPSQTTINGVAAALFDGTDDALEIAHNAAFSLASYTIIGVIDNDSAGGAFRAWIEKAAGASAFDRKWWVGMDPASSVIVANTESPSGIGGTGIDLTSPAGNTSPEILTHTKDGTTSATMHIDGSLVSTDLTVPTNSTNTQPVYIGGRFYPWLGKIGEILIYNSALSASDRQAVEAYLKAKWGTP